MGRRVASGVLVGFAALWLFVMLVVIRPWAVDERRAQLDAAQAQSRTLLAELGSPPEADTRGAPEESRSQRRMHVTIAQEFTTPGRFSETVDWYRARLAAAGWQPFDPAQWADFRVDFCKAPWLLELERSAAFEEGSDPSHRFRLRLSWSDGFRCPYTGW